MKNPLTLVSCIAIGGAGLLTSCMVDPYAGGGYQGHSTTTVTTYRPGYVVDRIPGSYQTEVIGGVSYYRHNDVYYRPQGRRYVVVEAPRRSDRYDPRERYDRRDPRDQDRRDPREYDRRAEYDSRPEYGDRRGNTTVIRTLPSGARVVTHRGARYYESRGTYYQPSNGGYVIVGSPF